MTRRIAEDPSADAARAAIIAAAGQCFARFGPRKTSMADIAKAARVGRQTLYRRFGNKEQVIEAFFFDRVARFSDMRRALTDAHADLEDQIVETFVGPLRLIKSDEALVNIVLEGGTHETELFLIGVGSPLHRIATDLWYPLLDQAHAAGRLRSTLTLDQAVQYIRALAFVLHLRTDLTEDDHIRFAKATVLVFLLRDKGNKYARDDEIRA